MGDEAVGSYAYEPLTTNSSYGKKYIRILTLLPNSSDAVPEITLKEVDIDDPAENYEALSYSWGAPVFSRSIVCNSLNLKVTENLYGALLHLRLPDRPRKLWIDAICINQSDISERNAQVRIMHEIYGTSGRVVIWLGTVEESDAIPAVHQQLIELQKRWADAKQREPKRFDFDMPDWAWDENLNPASELSLPLRRFLSRPWFERMWVIQEVSFARTATAMVGEHEIYWSTIADAFLYLSLYPDRQSGRINTDFISTLVAIDAKQTGLASQDPATYLDLSRLLQLTYKLGDATDPRDKVYALLNLSREGLSLIEPDYSPSNTTEDVFSETAAALIVHERSLSLLQSAEDTPDYYDLPSWVPDWRRPAETDSTQPRNSFRTLCEAANTRFRSTLGSPAVLLPSDNPRVLSIVGLTVAPISHIYDPFGGDLAREDPFAVLISPDLRFMVPFPSAPSLPGSFGSSDPFVAYAPTGELLSRAYARTLTADFWYTSARLQNSTSDSFKRLYMLSTHKLVEECMKSNPDTPLRDVIANGLFKDEEMMRLVRQDFLRLVRGMLVRRRFFLCEIGGLMGIGPEAMRVGDDVCLAEGCDVPLVIRYEGEPGSERSRLVGEAYVHGIMDGEMMRAVAEDTPWVRFDLH